MPKFDVQGHLASIADMQNSTRWALHHLDPEGEHTIVLLRIKPAYREFAIVGKPVLVKTGDGKQGMYSIISTTMESDETVKILASGIKHFTVPEEWAIAITKKMMADNAAPVVFHPAPKPVPEPQVVPAPTPVRAAHHD